MNRIITIIAYFFIASIILNIVYFVGGTFIYEYRTDFNNYLKYTFLLNDSTSKNLDPLFGNFGDVGNNNTISYFLTNDSIHITIWEFKNSEKINFKSIKFDKNVNFDNFEINRGVVLSSKSDLPITVEFSFLFKDSVIVNTDQYSKIDKLIENDKYIGFFGEINRLSLGNSSNKHSIIFDNYFDNKQALFLIYMYNKNLYIILINSRKSFDDTVINRLNLR